MLSWISVPSVATSVASGILVALLVEGVIALRVWLRRRSAVLGLRMFFQDFKVVIENVQEAEDGTVPREAFQFARWKAHVDDARLVVSSYAPYLRREYFVEIMEIIDGKQRLTQMTSECGVPQDFYDQYFERLRTVRWLKLDG